MANQQGRYLADLFNMHRVGVANVAVDANIVNGLPADLPKFNYKHLGTFAYVGADQAVLEMAMQGAPFMYRTLARRSCCDNAHVRHKSAVCRLKPALPCLKGVPALTMHAV